MYTVYKVQTIVCTDVLCNADNFLSNENEFFVDKTVYYIHTALHTFPILQCTL